MPSPAQAEKVGWHLLKFVRDPPVVKLALRLAACSVSALNDFTEPTWVAGRMIARRNGEECHILPLSAIIEIKPTAATLPPSVDA